MGTGNFAYMPNENIHVLKTRETKPGGDRDAAVLGHIVAAHTKLEKLRVFRQEMKAEFRLCQGERDAALRDVEQVRDQLSASDLMLEESEEIIAAQKTLIEELRAKQERPEKQAIRPTDSQSRLIASAVERHEQNMVTVGKTAVDGAQVDPAVDNVAENAVNGHASLLSRARDGLTGLFGFRKS